MLILFDHGTPRGLARGLRDHTIITAQAKGWDRLNNGDLLKAAETAEVDLLLTTDQRILVDSGLKAIGGPPLEFQLGSVLSSPWPQASRAMPD